MPKKARKKKSPADRHEGTRGLWPDEFDAIQVGVEHRAADRNVEAARSGDLAAGGGTGRPSLSSQSGWAYLMALNCFFNAIALGRRLAAICRCHSARAQFQTRRAVPAARAK